MKNKIVDVKNVLRVETLHDNLLNRSQIVPGMALIHGPSGFGKTTGLQYLFNQDTVNGIYVRCMANDTPTSILNRIAKECSLIPAGRAYQTLEDIIESMRRNEFSLFVDEVDYVVGNKRIMESFRDIYDSTEQPVVLVGMEEIARRISHRKQLFNRISEWIEFQPADIQDVSTFAEELLEVDLDIDEEVLDLIRQKSKGVVRTILSALSKIERSALASGINTVTLDDIDQRQLFMSIKRT